MCTSGRGGVYTSRGGGGKDPSTDAYDRTEKKNTPGMCTHPTGVECAHPGVVVVVEERPHRPMHTTELKKQGRAWVYTRMGWQHRVHPTGRPRESHEWPLGVHPKGRLRESPEVPSLGELGGGFFLFSLLPPHGKNAPRRHEQQKKET